MSGKLDIKQSLKKAYRKQRTTRSEIEVLRCELVKMLGELKLNESEEYHKGLLKDFLKKIAYKDHFINTKERSDLVIHNGKNSKTSVGVIIETKRPGNKGEMPTIDNINKKATQELLLYFLRERITQKNFEIKHLIATNLYEWFIFDAKEFEKIAENNKLKKHFKDFEEGRLIFDKTEFFYKEIASPVFEQEKNLIKFTHFDICDYEKHLKKQTQIGDKKLIELQKILSPIHLLKLPFANDSNTLNKDFYNELLHIIGLEEYKDKSKKLIRRKKMENRDEDSIIEAAITQITSLDKLSRIEDIERFGENTDEQLFNIGLELVITWINRVLFLKLLESQIVSYHQDNKDFLFLNIEKVPEYDDLNTLFFQVLAVEKKNRQKAILHKYPNIPYLNSSLFEPTELEQQTIVISNLPDNTSLTLYKKSVLKNGNENLKTLEYLYRFLDAYDFSSEGKEVVVEENKTLINASVLGLIFEKINGYKDGSFFTPGFVTMYMCRETIRRSIVRKFREQTDFDGNDFGDLVNFTTGIYKKAELKKYNEIVNSLKICDPAVGSGHFLVSSLNEIITIKAELGILMDENNKPLRNYLVDVENDELMILDENGDFFKYNPQNIQSLRVQKTLFYEKETIIEKCLFGVDINQNSAKICRLRLWIELLKNAYYKEDGELETLPNIDINIKCGNSLISRYPLDSDLKDVLKESKFSIDAYRLAVNTYRDAENKEQKHAMINLIDKIKGTFTEGIDKHHPKREKLAKLRGKLIALVDQGELFQTKTKKGKLKLIEKLSKDITKLEIEVDELRSGVIYNSAFEWRFEFPEVLNKKTGDYIGFDIIIGNPPYGLFNKKQNQQIALLMQEEAIRVIKRDFPEASHGGINACRIFYELALNLSKKNGYQSMIIPFGILTDKSSVKLRKCIFNCYSFLVIDAFPERDNIKLRVFEDSKMSTTIILTCKNQVYNKFNLGISYARKINTKGRFNLKYDDIKKISPDLCTIPITNPDEYKVLSKIYSNIDLLTLGSISKCLTGEADMTFAKKAMTKNSKDAVLIKGVQVDRFKVKFDPDTISQGEIEYLNLEMFQKDYKGKKLQDAQKRRLILQGVTGVNENFRLKATIIDLPAFLANSCNYILENKSIPLHVILGLINSKLLNFVFKCKSTNSNVNGYEVDELPIPKNIDETTQKNIGILVDKILSTKKKDVCSVTNKLENKIDQIVYKLYGLTEEEIAIVEGHIKD